MLVALGSFDAIIAYFVFITVVFIGLTVAGVWRIRRLSGPDRPGQVAPLLFLALVVLLLAMLLMSRPVQALAGAAIVLTGVPVYSVIARRTREPVNQ